MAKVNVTVDEWPDLVAAFLFDKLVNPEVIDGNEDFNEIAEKMGKKGMKSLLMSYYLHMDPQTRLQYKRLKNTFYAPEKTVIEVTGKGSEAGKKEKEGITKKVAKALLKKVVASKKMPEDEKNYLVELIKEDIE